MNIIVCLILTFVLFFFLWVCYFIFYRIKSGITLKKLFQILTTTQLETLDLLQDNWMQNELKVREFILGDKFEDNDQIKQLKILCRKRLVKTKKYIMITVSMFVIMVVLGFIITKIL